MSMLNRRFTHSYPCYVIFQRAPAEVGPKNSYDLCRHTGVVEKDTPTEKNTHWNLSFQRTKSGAGGQLLLLDRRARARIKGIFFSTDTGMNGIAGCYFYLHDNLHVFED